MTILVEDGRVITTYEQDQPINQKDKKDLVAIIAIFFDKAIITIGFLKLKLDRYQQHYWRQNQSSAMTDELAYDECSFTKK